MKIGSLGWVRRKGRRERGGEKGKRIRRNWMVEMREGQSRRTRKEIS